MPYRELKPDPLGIPRNPLAVYLLLLALVSGALTVSGAVASAAISRTLPYLAQLAWGVLLTAGSASCIVGMYWQGRITTGLLLKRLGMFTLAVSSALLSLVAAVGYGFGGILSAGIYAGFSLACAIQYRRLNARVRAIIIMTKDPLLLPLITPPSPPEDQEQAP